MNSDSDSDGSHISATPPRPPKPKPTLISSHSSRSTEKPKNLFPEKPPVPARPDPKPDPSPLSSDLPFQVLRLPPNQTLAVPAVDSFVTAKIHCKSTPSFLKNRRVVSVDSDPATYDPPFSFSAPPKSNEAAVATSGSDWVPPPPPQPKAEITKKKNVNLIRGNAPLPAVKLKGGAEGNFVKLNLNGRKRKFLNKGRRGNSSFLKN